MKSWPNKMSSIFTRIMQGEIPADIVYEDDQCMVINDIHPQAPVHMLVIPRKALVSLADVQAEDQALLGHLLLVASQVATLRGIDKGFRLIANNGKGAGQSVFHLHFHVLGGKNYSESSISR
jgi:histidine triad (HIT) family protein